MSVDVEVAAERPWLTEVVRGIGLASLLSELGHELPTSLLPSPLTTTLHAPASALGVISKGSPMGSAATQQPRSSRV